MAVRSSSPVSESLLWKARLLQHNAQLQREKDTLKIQVRELTEHVTCLDARLKAVTDLSDRVAIVEEDDKKRQEAIVSLDADRSKKLRLMEEKYEGITRKMNVLQGNINELIDERDERSQERDAYKSAVRQIGELDTKISGLCDRCNTLKAEVNSVNGTISGENRSIHLALAAIAKKVEELAANPLGATSVPRQEEVSRKLALNDGGQRTAKTASPKSSRLAQSSSNLSKGTSMEKPAVAAKARQSLAGIMEANTEKQPAKQQRGMPVPLISSHHLDEARQADRPQGQKQQGLGVAPKWRLRTTRAGPSGWSRLPQRDEAQLSPDSSRHPSLQHLANKAKGELPTCEVSPLSKKRPREEGGLDYIERLDTSSPLSTKRAMPAQTLRGLQPTKDANSVKGTLSNTSTSVMADVVRTKGQRQPVSTERAEPPANTRLMHHKNSAAPNLDAVQQLSSAIQSANQRGTAQPTASTESRALKRRRARVPNLPPTPPPLSP